MERTLTLKLKLHLSASHAGDAEVTGKAIAGFAGADLVSASWDDEQPVSPASQVNAELLKALKDVTEAWRYDDLDKHLIGNIEHLIDRAEALPAPPVVEKKA